MPRSLSSRLILALFLVATLILLFSYVRHENKGPSISSDHHREVALGWLPDPTLTPGEPDPSMTLERVCTESTKDRRHVTPAERRAVFASYGMPNDHSLWCATPGKCEMDHLCSIELGCTNSPKNLWPQPYEGEWNAHMKDKLENRLHAMMCRGELTMPEAQHAIITNWIAAYQCMGSGQDADCMRKVSR